MFIWKWGKTKTIRKSEKKNTKSIWIKIKTKWNQIKNSLKTSLIPCDISKTAIEFIQSPTDFQLIKQSRRWGGRDMRGGGLVGWIKRLFILKLTLCRLLNFLSLTMKWFGFFLFSEWSAEKENPQKLQTLEKEKPNKFDYRYKYCFAFGNTSITFWVYSLYTHSHTHTLQHQTKKGC